MHGPLQQKAGGGGGQCYRVRQSLVRPGAPPPCDNAGMQAARVSIQTEDFDVSAELAALRGGDARVGAVCSFIGTVRDRNEGAAVASMELEHYPGMTEKSIEAIIDEAVHRFGIHRSEEHTSELQSPCNLVCRLLLEKKKNQTIRRSMI